ncbi:hypothetical protein HYH03_001850 [Edaphochlamys debaryana]|uniref:SCP domain-containing protein n=1 Tax=Edaphochlamys debaryana TaxID=47281 RepID=A0A835YEM6_9CHLO|nr:hypothetical protein HYH03_001850 [Edaphochlamys debaryana]|eukprot:KAG2500272.1 hypothetical protein HYH03_001850 [Edaphochlamys debaryana]
MPPSFPPLEPSRPSRRRPLSLRPPVPPGEARPPGPRRVVTGRVDRGTVRSPLPPYRPPSPLQSPPPPELPPPSRLRPPPRGNAALSLAPGINPGAILAAHNAIRRLSGVPDLVWDDSIAQAAQSWANQCGFDHEPTDRWGENLVTGGGGSTEDFVNGVNMWGSEICGYDWTKPNGDRPSHYTQVAWRGTQRVGCGYKMCMFNIFVGEGMFVCKYWPPGNVWGQIKANVLPPKRNVCGSGGGFYELGR